MLNSFKKLKERYNVIIFLRIFRITWRHYFTLIPAVFLTVFCSFSKLAIPYQTGGLAHFLKVKDQKKLAEKLKQIFFLMLTSKIVHLVKKLFVDILNYQLMCDLRSLFYKGLLNQDITFYDLHKSSDLYSMLTSEINEFKHATVIQYADLVKRSIELFGAVTTMFYISFKLSLLFFTIIPIINKFFKYARSIRSNSNSIIDQYRRKAYSKSLECLQNIKIVKTFKTEEKEYKKYKELIDNNLYMEITTDIKDSVINCISSIFYFTGILFTVRMGVFVLKDLTVNDISRFSIYGFLLFDSIMGYNNLINCITNSFIVAGRVFNIIDHMPDINPLTPETGICREIEGNIKFKNVNFTYPSKDDVQVLKNVTFEVKKGEKLGIVGTSGGGKSTIISLLERMYDPNNKNVDKNDNKNDDKNDDNNNNDNNNDNNNNDNNEEEESGVFIDNINIKKYCLKNLLQQIGYVQQEPSLFQGTILENIIYGLERPYTKEEIEDVILKSKCEFIYNEHLFPKGLNTQVGEKGTQLSGGQKQRVAIARALIKKPKILILDEATSALDSQNEAAFQNMLNLLNKDVTIIVVAHRLSTIKNSDKIIVLSEGQIMEIGNHDELIANDGVYKHLMQQQMIEEKKKISIEKQKKRIEKMNLIKNEKKLMKKCDVNECNKTYEDVIFNVYKYKKKYINNDDNLFKKNNIRLLKKEEKEEKEDKINDINKNNINNKNNIIVNENKNINKLKNE